MSKEYPVTFQVTIHSMKNVTWQGVLSLGDEERTFESEMQLLMHMMEMAPDLSSKSGQRLFDGNASLGIQSV